MGDDPAEISFGQAIPQDILDDSFGLVAVVPPLAPELGFRVALPNDWAQDPEIPMAPLEQEAFSQAAMFRAPDGDISFQALATSIPFEVCLLDWLKHQSAIHDFSLLNAQSYDTETGQVVHAVGQADSGGHLRVLVVGNGPSVFLCLGRAPEDASEETIETLGLAAAAFEFVETDIARTREPIVTFTDRDRMFRVLHPASWSPETLNRLRPRKAGVDFRLTGDDDETLGYLRVEADTRHPCDEEGLERMLELTLDGIGEAGVEIQALQAYTEEEGQPPDRWIGDCTFGESQAQIAIVLRPTAACWLSVLAFYPRREDDPWAWMRGKRAYEIASATVEPAGSGWAAAAGASSSGFEIQ
jgi:hypothetical protein